MKKQNQDDFIEQNIFQPNSVSNNVIRDRINKRSQEQEAAGNYLKKIYSTREKQNTELIFTAHYLISIAKYDDLPLENKKHLNLDNLLSMATKLNEIEDNEEEEEEEEDEKIDIAKEIKINNDTKKGLDKEEKEKDKINPNKEINKQNI